MTIIRFKNLSVAKRETLYYVPRKKSSIFTLRIQGLVQSVYTKILDTFQNWGKL